MGFLKNISIANFRNYDNLFVELKPRVNILVGGNGQGKTSLLEAIYFLSVLRSFRCQQVKNLFRWGEKRFSVKGVILNDNLSITLEVHYGETRRLAINGVNVSKASEILGQILCTAFLPGDIRLIKGTNIERRRFLDTTLSLLYPSYLPLIQDYHRALKSRNSLLKQESPDLGVIKSFDTILIRTGARIAHYRIQLCRTLAGFIGELSHKMFSKGQKLGISYEYSYPFKGDDETSSTIELALVSAFQENLSRDIHYRQTHVGPHRENFSLLLDQKSLQDFGSEGQCRLAVLILKMATGELFLMERKNDTVVFLVDDVTGELDKRHQKLFFELLDRADQVFFACTDENKISEINSSIIFEIHAGKAKIYSQ